MFEPLEVCHCHCHRVEGVKHCAPCCYRCPHCGQRIKTNHYDDHVERCEPAKIEIGIVVKEDKGEGS